MSVIFNRDNAKGPFDAAGNPVKGHAVVLRIANNLGQLDTVGTTLTIDGKPIDGLVQKIAIEIDAATRLPKLTIQLIPAKLEIEYTGEADVKLVPLRAHSLTSSETRIVAGDANDPKVKELLEQYGAWKKETTKEE